MINLLENEGNLIYYKCDCGVTGRCMIKPLGKEGAIVVNIKCAMCETMDRIVLLQYKSEAERKRLLENLNECELSWSLVLSNEIVN